MIKIQLIFLNPVAKGLFDFFSTSAKYWLIVFMALGLKADALGGLSSFYRILLSIGLSLPFLIIFEVGVGKPGVLYPGPIPNNPFPALLI